MTDDEKYFKALEIAASILPDAMNHPEKYGISDKVRHDLEDRQRFKVAMTELSRAILFLHRKLASEARESEGRRI